MNKRVTLKRMLVLLLTFTMTLGCLNITGPAITSEVVNAKELAIPTDSEVSVTTDGETEGENIQYENTYSSENFDVKFKLDNVWGAGYNATITITNTSDSVIENWCLTFPLNETISNIWNATISKEHKDFYVIKNVGWNQDIPVGGSVSFGMTVYEPFTQYPEYYTIIGNQVETKSEDYTVDYKITQDWGDGYKAEVTISNNKTTAIEDWRLSFEYGDNLITQIWNAVILSEIDGVYELSCETYNQNIAPGASVTFGFMVEPGCSGKLVENVALKEYVAVSGDEDDTEDDGEDSDASESAAIICGILDDEDNKALYVSMMASVEIEKYEIFVSYDGGECVKVGETEESEYEYNLGDGFSIAEIYAIGYDMDGQAIETNHIFVECVDGVYMVILPDTDSDGLEDVYEIYYGSDVNLLDTDGDGLSDYYEVYMSSTYPSVVDSDENGILDCDEDYDGDGLSIVEECKQGTDPLDPDTDYDNLADGDEVNVYGTDPLVADKDEDGLVDGDEIAVGTDPSISDTDGDGVLDNEERFQQTYTHQVENPDCVVKEVSVTLEGTGNLQSTTNIESVMNKDILCSGVVGLVGEPFEIETASEFEEATITFKIDKDILGDVPFEDLMFLWYDEENDRFVELETELNYELKTVSVKTTHFSKYMLVDMKAWYDAWLKELDYTMGYYGGIDRYTIMAIECSVEMNDYDPIIYKKVEGSRNPVKSCYRTMAAKKNVDDMGINDVASVVYFDGNTTTATVLCRRTEKDLLLKHIQTIWLDGGASYSKALYTCYQNFETVGAIGTYAEKKVILTVVGNRKQYFTSTLEKLIESDIVVDVVLVGNEEPTEQLIELCNSTGGKMYRADTSEHLSDVYDNIYEWDRVDKTDSDGDGLYDVVEKAGIRLTNNQIIYTDPYDDDSDDDGLLDGQEVTTTPRMYYKEIEVDGVKEIRKVYEFSWTSDPNNPDTEGDGIRDDGDNMPFVKGFYSESSGKVVVGELTIVSSTYNGPIGHSFLVYKSYVNDSLDFSKLNGGYKVENNIISGISYYKTYASFYNISRNEYITIGNTGTDLDSNGFESCDGLDKDSAGIFYNREFAVEISHYAKGKRNQKYKNNEAYGRQLTEEQMDMIILVHSNINYYHFFENNCAYTASMAWNKAFFDELNYYEFDEYDYFGNKYRNHINTPLELKKAIRNKKGCYEFNSWVVLGLRI